MTAALDLAFVRSQFPALAKRDIFLDNAGGTQVVDSVSSRLADYLTTTNVQPLQSSYPLALEAAERLSMARRRLAHWINAKSVEELVLGSSTTLLLFLLSISFGRTVRPGDEIIVTNCDHEANIGCWEKLRAQGAVIKYWKVRPDYALHMDDLVEQITSRTRLVCLTHCSNVFGTINPIKDIASLAHESGALVCVDGVAFAPHRLIDVQEFEADFYAFSFYKTFGPHYAVLYVRRELLLALPGINHFFVPEEDIPYKLQPGNANYEFTYAAAGIVDYLETLGGKAENRKTAADLLAIAYEQIARHEQDLAKRLLKYLNERDDVIVLGSRSADLQVRVPTISFVVNGKDSRQIVGYLDRHGVGIRCGDLYARRFYDAAGLAQYHGIIRASMVHYNSAEEVDMLVEALDAAIGQGAS